MFESEVLTLDVDGHVATLWLDRSDSRNALGRAFWCDLPRAAEFIANEPSIRAVVVAAKGSDFSVGLDLKEFGGSPFADSPGASHASANRRAYDAVRAMQGAVSAVANLEMPVIAAVHGYCIGGGVDLICACDIRLCAEDATFSVRETRVAIVADLGTLQRLPRIVGAGHVAELAYTGKDIDAARAKEIGLVNAIYLSADDVVTEALKLAGEIAANSPLAVRGTKAVLAANDGRTVEEGLDFVARWNTLYLRSNDFHEAMAAFAQRRSPEFKGD